MGFDTHILAATRLLNAQPAPSPTLDWEEPIKVARNYHNIHMGLRAFTSPLPIEPGTVPFFYGSAASDRIALNV